MAGQDLIIKLFIASPGELIDERDIVEGVVAEIQDALPVDSTIAFRVLRYENETGEHGRPQGQLNPMVDVCNVFVGILGGRLGSPSGTHRSGFVEEYERAVERRSARGSDVPRIFLFIKEVSVHSGSRKELLEVREFVDGIKERREALLNFFTTPEELATKLRAALMRLVTSVQEATPSSSLALAGQAGGDVKLSELARSSDVAEPEVEDDRPPEEEGPDEGGEPRSPRDPGPSIPPDAEPEPSEPDAEEPQPLPATAGEDSEAGAEREAAEAQFADPAVEPTTANWKQLLVTPLLRDGGQEETEREAEELSENDPARAADLFSQVGQALAPHELALADLYLDRAAHLYRQSQRELAAADLFEQAAWDQLARGASSWAGHQARQMLDLLGEDQRWRAAGLLAMTEWPERSKWSTDALRNALDACGEDPRRWPYGAQLTSLLILERAYQEVIGVADRLGATVPSSGPALDIHLDYLDALEVTAGSPRAENAWRQLIQYAEQLSDDDNRVAAQIWQRRGVTLAVRGEVDHSRSAYFRAAILWRADPGTEDQVKECFFSAQLAGGLNGEFFNESERLRPFIAHISGNALTPVSVADHLEELGMHSHLRGKPFDALRNYGLALDKHRRAGNLRGQSFVQELLGELNLQSDRPLAALSAFVQAGREADAAKAAEQVAGDEILEALDLGPARWRRSASLAAVAAVGRRLTSHVVSELAETVVSDAARPMVSLVTPQPEMRAQEALASIAFELPDELRERGWQRLRELALGGYVGTARPAAEALTLLTNAGISDETSTLVDAFLEDASISGISPIWVGEQLPSHATEADAVLAAARGGSLEALEALAVANLISQHHDLVELCARHVQSTLDIPVVERTGNAVSVGIGAQYEFSALLGRYCRAELRERLAHHLADIATGAEAPLQSRASAANAIFNLAQKLDRGVRLELSERLEVLLEDDIPLSRWDGEDPGVMSRFRFSIGSVARLRAAALTAWSKLREGEAEDLEERALLERASSEPDAGVARAAFDSLAIRSEVAFPIAAAAGMAHENAGVRATALSCWITRTGSLPSPALLDRMLGDPHPAVRLTLLSGAQELPGAASAGVIESLAEDRDAYVRARARQAADAATSA